VLRGSGHNSSQKCGIVTPNVLRHDAWVAFATGERVRLRNEKQTLKFHCLDFSEDFVCKSGLNLLYNCFRSITGIVRRYPCLENCLKLNVKKML
jgi:hypothetical protein